MQINADQLARHLERGLAPAYVVSGDEPLLIDECCALIRARAAADGYERTLYTAGPGFDWDQLRTASQSLSLFAARLARDYFLARDGHGARLWVFRERRERGAWYLHGVFA